MSLNFAYLYVFHWKLYLLYLFAENYHVFQVLCRHLGEQTLTVNVGNDPTARNKFPARSSATVR